MGSESRNEFTIVWRIENFSFWCHNPDQKWIPGPKCIAQNLEKKIFYLRLTRRSEEPVNEEYLFFCLYSERDIEGDESIPIECTIEIIDGDGETLQSKTFPKSTESRFHRVKKAFPKNTVSGFIMTEWENVMKVDELLNKMKNWTEDTLTVRWHILGKVHTLQPAIECEVTTKIGLDRCSFLWKVKYTDTSDWSESKNFCFLDTTQMYITLSASEDDVFMHIHKEGTPNCNVIYKISLLDISGNERYSLSTGNLFRNFGAVWKTPFFSKTLLEDNKDTLLDDVGRFTLTCNFSIRNGIDLSEIKYRTFPQVNTPCMTDAVSSLQSDLRDMSTSKKHADVKLRVDNEIFPAHKCLLSSRSPVFSAMFDQDMLESQTGSVDIDDMDVKTMNSFLEFMYTGTLDVMDYENASKLLLAADKYQVLSLKEKSASFLKSILSQENVCEILTLADMVGHELLKATSFDYIKLHAGNILRSPQWLKWFRSNVQLAGEIICMMSSEMATDK